MSPCPLLPSEPTGPENLAPALASDVLARMLVKFASLRVHLVPPCWLETRGKMMKCDVSQLIPASDGKGEGKGEIYIYTHSLEGEIYRA